MPKTERIPVCKVCGKPCPEAHHDETAFCCPEHLNQWFDNFCKGVGVYQKGKKLGVG